VGLVVYNTLTNKKEKFVPIEEGKVKLYLCGPTVYDLLHIGNFRGPITFNLMRNWMEESGMDVNFVYNYTDIDDKIINKAIAEGVESSVISERYIVEFEKDFNRLGLRPHTHNPRVSEYMDQIIDIVKTLLEKRKAYEIDGEVFYEIETFSEYGKLSNNKLEDLQAGQRVEVDEKKRHPADFVLWKPSKTGEPGWDSPWGKGRPGWHIECSAMVKAILGDTIDIHGGGIDLTFPHHECEIAQSEGCSDKTYCNYWIHNNFINMGDEKMSKSLGNIISCRAFMDQYHPEILKYAFLSAHYRTVLTLSDDKILHTVSALNRIYSSLLLANETISAVSDAGVPETGFTKKIDELTAKIKKALNDDFNTADFISYVFEAVRAFNALGFANKKKRNSSHKGNSEIFTAWMNKYGKMAALFNEEPKTFLDQLDKMLIRLRNIDKDAVEALVSKRNEARESKDWDAADKYRVELEDLGIELFDGSSRGWRVKTHES
jgi:cysteinyl-tRNA synthetase